MEEYRKGQTRGLKIAVGVLAGIGAAEIASPVLEAFLFWAARNPDRVQQAGQMFLEGAGGPPGLTLAPNSRLRKTEVDGLERLGRQLGSRLIESSHVGEEVVVAGTKKTIDIMGHAEAYSRWSQRDQAKFFGSITDHLLKSVTYIAIDLKGASKEQIGQITSYVNGLTKAQRDRIIYVSP